MYGTVRPDKRGAYGKGREVLWHIGRVDVFQPEGHRFESRSSRYIRTLGKSFTYSYL